MDHLAYPHHSSTRPACSSRGGRMAAIAVIIALITSACGDDATAPSTDSSSGGSGSTVIATTSIWADVVSNLACDGLAEVDTIIPPGGDSHSFEPSLADRGRMGDADLLVANGLGLEERLDDTIDAVAESGTPVFRIGEHIDTIDVAGPTDEHEGSGEDASEAHDSDEEHRGVDPHVWFDPVRVSAALPSLADELVTRARLDADAVAGCLARYQQQLVAAHADIEEILSVVPRANRRLVTNHEALGYFADRYGFEVIGTVIPGPSSLAETNPAQLQEVAELVEDTGLPAIFAEIQVSATDAEALADRLDDVEVLTLYTEGLGEPGSGADTYIGLLRTDAQLIADGLAPG